MSTVSSDLRPSGGPTILVRPSARAKVMRLRVDPRSGKVVLTVPKRMSERKALEWASGHQAWIEAALGKVPPPVRIGPGAEIPLKGILHRIDWNPAYPRAVRAESGTIRVGGPREMIEARLLRWLREEARRLLTLETAEYAEAAGLAAGPVSVGDPVSRWGSCSSSGAIRYSWRLIMAPDHVRRATVAHEVAHRVHMNHGPQFHGLVRDLYGADPAPARAWLRREGHALHRIGLLV